MHNIALVLFTVFLQAATGLLLFQGIYSLFNNKSDSDMRIAKMHYPLICMWALFIFAILISITHLGKPGNILSVFNGISSGSPMSFEIITMSIFGLTVLLYTICLFLKVNEVYTKLFLCLSMLMALVQSYAVASVYMIVTIPLWDSMWTLAQFFMSAIALGCTAMLIFIYSNSPQNSMPKTLMRWNSAGVIILLALIVISASFSTLVMNLPFEGEPLTIFLPWLRIGLLALAIIILMLIGTCQLRPAINKYLSIFLCVLGSEIAGRIFFYDLQQVSGMLQVFSH